MFNPTTWNWVTIEAARGPILSGPFQTAARQQEEQESI